MYLSFFFFHFFSFFFLFFFFFNDTATTEIYTLSLHDALPICCARYLGLRERRSTQSLGRGIEYYDRSEEHTSELQSHVNLVCRLLLEKKKKNIYSFVLVNKKNIQDRE